MSGKLKPLAAVLILLTIVFAGATLLPPSVSKALVGSEAYAVLNGATLAMVFLSIGWGINLAKARTHVWLVLAVVFLGVPVKFGITLWLTGVFGQDVAATVVMAMVQVEATSAAIIMANKRMSEDARTAMGLIAMWDDPVTAAAVEGMQGGWGIGLFWATLPYLALAGVGVAFAIFRWAAPRWVAAMLRRGKDAVARLSKKLARFRWLAQDVQLTLLAVVVVSLSVWQEWFTLAAVAGLILRPRWIAVGATKSARAALARDEEADVLKWEGVVRNILIALAFVQMGPFLAGGVQLEAGAALGASVYIAHATVITAALLLYRGFGGAKGREFGGVDLLLMACCQLNGLTAVSLGNDLGVMAAQVVAVALLAVGGCYIAANGFLWAVLPPGGNDGGKNAPVLQWAAAIAHWWQENGPPSWRFMAAPNLACA